MAQTLTFYMEDEAATASFGRKLAAIAKKGDVFALYGTLGMGKSVLARAFIQALCGPVEVPSPTFTLVQSYEAPQFEIYHFDLYRIKKPEEIFEIGVEDAMYDGVCLIEWPGNMEAYLPVKAFRIEITPSQNGRRISVSTVSGTQLQRVSAVNTE